MMGSVNYITTIINLRAPGMTLYRMPMTIWAMFITAILQAFALPVLTVALILQLARQDHQHDLLPARRLDVRQLARPASGGGQPLLWQHLFWFYSHPAVYIMILPAMGMVSDIISTFAAGRCSATGPWSTRSPASPGWASSSGAIICSRAAWTRAWGPASWSPPS